MRYPIFYKFWRYSYFNGCCPSTHWSSEKNTCVGTFIVMCIRYCSDHVSLAWMQSFITMQYFNVQGILYVTILVTVFVRKETHYLQNSFKTRASISEKQWWLTLTFLKSDQNADMWEDEVSNKKKKTTMKLFSYTTCIVL